MQGNSVTFHLPDCAPGAAEIMEGVMLNGEKSKEELKEITEQFT